MSDRAKKIMEEVWQHRNNGADTEEKLVAAILYIASDNIQHFTAQDGRVVLDKNDLLNLVVELTS
jgi:hypothetical protein